MKLLYAKQNLQRKPEFRMHTMIYRIGKKRVVKKYIENEEASHHFDDFLKNYNHLQSKVKIISLPKIIRKDKLSVELEYLDLPSLEVLIEKTIIERQYSQTLTYLTLFRNLVDDLDYSHVNPYKNEKFIDYFDPEKKYFANQNEDCIKVGIFDLNFDNILLKNENRLYLLDWEWIHDFPIPKRFIIFRSLFYLCNKLQYIIATHCSPSFPSYEAVRHFLIPVAWFELFNFSQKEIERYLFYEHKLQNKTQLINYRLDLSMIMDKKRVFKERYSLNLEKYINIFNDEIMNLKKEIIRLNKALRLNNPFVNFVYTRLRKIKNILLRKNSN